MRAVLLSALVAALAVSLAPAPAGCGPSRCRCVADDDLLGLRTHDLVRAQLAEAAAVVLVTVARVDTLPARAGDRAGEGRPVVARLRVERRWKGAPADTTTVAFARVPDGFSCETSFAPGERYLVFALGEADGLLWTGRCTGTQHARAASRAVATLDALHRPAAR